MLKAFQQIYRDLRPQRLLTFSLNVSMDNETRISTKVYAPLIALLANVSI